MREASTRLPEQGTQTASPAPDLIRAETESQPRTHIAIGTVNGGTSHVPSGHGKGLRLRFDLSCDALVEHSSRGAA